MKDPAEKQKDWYL